MVELGIKRELRSLQGPASVEARSSKFSTLVPQAQPSASPGCSAGKLGAGERKKRLLYIHISGIFLVLCF